MARLISSKWLEDSPKSVIKASVRPTLKMENVCPKCDCNLLRWKHDGWTCFECGNHSDVLKTISHVSSDDWTQLKSEAVDALRYKQAPKFLGAKAYYDKMKTFKQFIKEMEQWKN